jgi:hypothetical protein
MLAKTMTATPSDSGMDIEFETDFSATSEKESMAGPLSEAAVQATLREFEILFDQFTAQYADDEDLILAEIAKIAQNPKSVLNALIMLL